MPKSDAGRVQSRFTCSAFKTPEDWRGCSGNVRARAPVSGVGFRGRIQGWRVKTGTNRENSHAWFFICNSPRMHAVVPQQKYSDTFATRTSSPARISTSINTLSLSLFRSSSLCQHQASFRDLDPPCARPAKSDHNTRPMLSPWPD